MIRWYLPYSWSLLFAIFYVDVFHVDGILPAVKMLWTWVIWGSGKHLYFAITFEFCFWTKWRELDLPWIYHQFIIFIYEIVWLCLFLAFWFDLLGHFFLYIIYYRVNSFVLDIWLRWKRPPAIHNIFSIS